MFNVIQKLKLLKGMYPKFKKKIGEKNEVQNLPNYRMRSKEIKINQNLPNMTPQNKLNRVFNLWEPISRRRPRPKDRSTGLIPHTNISLSSQSPESPPSKP